jgi:DinB superfamily
MMTTETIAGQYQSALRMFGRAIELCPEEVWLSASGSSPNRFWHIAYHTLFYTHLYLAPSLSEFTPWPKGRPDDQFLGAVPERPDEKHVVETPYSQADLLEYVAFLHGEIELRTKTLDLEAPSGFYWLPFEKLEVQLYNLRHIAHHTGQLAERLRTQANIGLPWVR